MVPTAKTVLKMAVAIPAAAQAAAALTPAAAWVAMAATVALVVPILSRQVAMPLMEHPDNLVAERHLMASVVQPV
jgi:hypothetical protein